MSSADEVNTLFYKFMKELKDLNQSPESTELALQLLDQSQKFIRDAGNGSDVAIGIIYGVVGNYIMNIPAQS